MDFADVLPDAALFLADRLLVPVVVALITFSLTRKYYEHKERERESRQRSEMLSLVLQEHLHNYCGLAAYKETGGTADANPAESIVKLPAQRAFLREIGGLPRAQRERFFGAYVACEEFIARHTLLSSYYTEPDGRPTSAIYKAKLMDVEHDLVDGTISAIERAVLSMDGGQHLLDGVHQLLAQLSAGGGRGPTP